MRIRRAPLTVNSSELPGYPLRAFRKPQQGAFLELRAEPAQHAKDGKGEHDFAARGPDRHRDRGNVGFVLAKVKCIILLADIQKLRVEIRQIGHVGLRACRGQSREPLRAFRIGGPD